MPIIVKVEFHEYHALVHLDDGEKLKIPADIVGLHGLAANREIDTVQYRDLREESELFCCRERALSYLAPRARSVYEMRAYLKRKGFSSIAIDRAIDFLTRRKYLDDAAYALALVKSKTRSKAMGPALLKKELMARGIGRAMAERAIRESGAAEADPEQVYAAARKKFDSLGGDEKALARAYRFLLQRGFSHDDTKRAVERIRHECGDSESGE
jgi:regulatory protein